MKTFTLQNNIKIPQLGFGVYLMTPKECETSIINALNDGYRHIDTANAYMNEKAVGRAIKKSGMKRQDIFVTTKLWPSEYGFEKSTSAIEKTLKRLDTEYIDLLLLHQQYGDYLGAWKAMEKAVQSGKVRSIGLSNFNFERLKNVMNNAKVMPSVLQVECHPYFQQEELKAFAKLHNIKIEAWYPIGHGDKKLINEPLFSRLAEKYGKSNVQIILRWHIQDGNIVLPKSTNPQHIKSNIDIFDFELTENEMQEIKNLNQNKRYFNMDESQQEQTFLNWSPDFDNQE